MGTAIRFSEEYFKENPPQFTITLENRKTNKVFTEKYPNEFFYEKRMNRVRRGTSLIVVGETKHY